MHNCSRLSKKEREPNLHRRLRKKEKRSRKNMQVHRHAHSDSSTIYHIASDRDGPLQQKRLKLFRQDSRSRSSHKRSLQSQACTSTLPQRCNNQCTRVALSAHNLQGRSPETLSGLMQIATASTSGCGCSTAEEYKTFTNNEGELREDKKHKLISCAYSIRRWEA